MKTRVIAALVALASLAIELTAGLKTLPIAPRADYRLFENSVGNWLLATVPPWLISFENPQDGLVTAVHLLCFTALGSGTWVAVHGLGKSTKKSWEDA